MHSDRYVPRTPERNIVSRIIGEQSEKKQRRYPDCSMRDQSSVRAAISRQRDRKRDERSARRESKREKDRMSEWMSERERNRSRTSRFHVSILFEAYYWRARRSKSSPPVATWIFRGYRIAIQWWVSFALRELRSYFLFKLFVPVRHHTAWSSSDLVSYTFFSYCL